jgi:hypothetical protein
MQTCEDNTFLFSNATDLQSFIKIGAGCRFRKIRAKGFVSFEKPRIRQLMEKQGY